MTNIIYLEEWKRLRHMGKQGGKPMRGNRRRTSSRNTPEATASIGDLSAELLRLLSE